MTQLTLELARWSSILLQLVAAVMALLLIPLTGRGRGWLLISAGLVLTTAVRVVPLLPALAGQPTAPVDPLQEAVRLVASTAFLVGIAGMGPHFREQRRVAAGLRARHDRAHHYLDVAGSMLVGLDTAGHVTLLNQAASRILGVSEHDALGEDWFERFVPQSRRERVHWWFDEMLDSRHTDRDYMEYPVVTASGEERTIAWRHSLLRGDDGTAAGMLSSGDDITDDLAAEKELRFQSLLLDSATDSIVVHDLEGRLVYVNEAAAQTRGWTREEMLGLPPFGWTGAEPDLRTTILREILESGSSIWESLSVRADGSVFPTEVHARPLYSGERTLIVSVIRDATDRKQSEELIARMAFYDPLTGLANRTLFGDRLGIAIAHAHPRLRGTGRDVPRHRPLQDHQRHARTRGRGRAAAVHGVPPARPGPRG